MYSTTYKRCPFCDGTGDPDNALEDGRRGGGKRLVGSGGPGWSLGSIVGGIISLLLIIAAICIVVSVVKSLMGGGEPKPTPTPSAAPSESQSVESQPVESQPVESVEPTPSVEPSVEPTPDASVPTGFTLNSTDFTFFNAGETFTMRVTFTPSGASAPVVWSTSDSKVATISENGKVVAVGKGTCRVKATVEGVGEKTCIVRCNFKDTADATPAPTPTPSGSTSSSDIKISSTDFTLFKVGETNRLRISGTTETVVWASSNTDVATVDASGLVTAVGKGTCTVTATVDGQTFKCIVRCNIKSE